MTTDASHGYYFTLWRVSPSTPPPGSLPWATLLWQGLCPSAPQSTALHGSVMFHLVFCNLCCTKGSVNVRTMSISAWRAGFWIFRQKSSAAKCVASPGSSVLIYPTKGRSWTHCSPALETNDKRINYYKCYKMTCHMNVAIHDHRANTRSNAIVVGCNQLNELWISYTDYQVIHKEAAAFDLLLKMFEPHKMFRLWVMAGLRKEILGANKYCFWTFPGFIFPSSFYRFPFHLVMTPFSHILWQLLPLFPVNTFP